jgi:radical SAM superfamily enzyme YgiQ (UPF0313 family)
MKNPNILMAEQDSVDRKRIAKELKERFPAEIKKILLIQPVQLTEDGIDINIARNRRYYMYPPYSLGVLNTNLKKRGYEVSILDLNYDVFNTFFENSDKSYTNEEITTLWKKFFKEKLKNFKPDMIGLSCTFTMGHDLLVRTAAYSRKLYPEIPIIAGGVHVTNAPDIVLKEGPAIDFVSLYEGDKTFCDVVDFINGNIEAEALSQIGTRVEEKYIKINARTVPEPNALDIIPDYDDLNIGNYSNLGEIGTFRFWRDDDAIGSSVLSNRGCRARCTFCSVANFNGPGVRGRSVESVVDEIQHLKETYGVNHITWLDDDLFYNPKRTVELFREIANRNLNITWDASNGIIGSAAVTHKDLVEAAAESGCLGMYFGIESGNDEILRKVKKPSGVRHFSKLGKLMDQYPKIFTRGFLMMGFPKETLGQIYDTVKLAHKMNLDWYTVQLLTPLPSTAIYNEMVEEGMIEDGSLNTEGEGFTMFSVRESERQRRKEKKQKFTAKEFYNMFERELDRVPSKPELSELWFLVDYEINYRRIFDINDETKLEKIKNFLVDISDRMTFGNPLSNLFVGIIEEKLGNTEEANDRKTAASKFVQESDYWKKRFDVLGLEEFLC